MRWPARLLAAGAALLTGVALTACGVAPDPVIPSGPAPATAPAGATRAATTTAPAGPARFIPAAAVPATALALIAQARHTCDVELYELGNPALIAALITDAHRGVAVHVILDGTESQSRLAAPVLRAAGVPVETVTLPHQGLDHVKLLVVDGSATLTGGVNWGVSSTDTTDADVLLPSDPLAAQTFAADWRTAAHPVTSGAWPDPAGPGAWSGRAIAAEAVQLIATSTGPIDVAANYATDWQFQDALAAAAARGLTVRVVLNPTAYGATAAAQWLTAHGIRVREAPTRPYLHAKLLITGSTGLIGSANFSYDAWSARNHEFDVTLPASVVPTATQWFATLWGASTPGAGP
jgi:cardiolipin synthase